MRDSYQDKDGNWHDFYRTETYPDYVPAREIPYAVVTMTFEWYDVESGELIASSEDVTARAMRRTIRRGCISASLTALPRI